MIYRFANCTLDIAAHKLTVAGREQDVEPQVFDLLHLLLRHAGELVTRDALIEAIWQGRIVSDSAIDARIAAARRAVGDTGKTQTIIRTIPRRGLQCVAEVSTDAVAATTPNAAVNIRYATTPDGVSLAYTVSGSGHPILTAPHFPTHLELDHNDPIDAPFVAEMIRDNTLIRYDQRGTGLSDLDGIWPSATDRTIEIKTIADAAGADRFAIYASNSGTFPAVRFAVENPDRVSHMIFMAGYAQGRQARLAPSDQKGTDNIAEMQREGWNNPDSPFIRAWISVYFPSAPQSFVTKMARTMQGYCPVENVTAMREMTMADDVLDLLPQIKCPTLVLHARGDAVHPLSEGQKLAKGIPGAELVVLDTDNFRPLPDEPAWRVKHDAIRRFLAAPLT